MDELVYIAVGLLPVLSFLAALIFMDSYKLVTLRSVMQAILVGCVVTVACLYLNTWLIEALDISRSSFSRGVAPFTEELVKSVYVIYLIRTSKVGFMVDAAIYGFAIGTGFELFENLHYLHDIDDPGMWRWIIRGFGTGITHGSTMAIFAIISKGLTERHESSSLRLFLPGLGVAIGIHALWNQFFIHPLVATAAVLVVLPLLIVFVFEVSERATRSWLGVGFDSDTELLELITSEEISQTRVGRYLESLRSTFPSDVVADMLCLLRIHLELSIRAKGVLLARAAGMNMEVDSEVRANFEELKHLERSVGKTGKLAILPFLSNSSRDLWQLYMLGR